MMATLVLRDLDARHVARQYEKVLEQLRQGDFPSAEVKKLRGSGLYRAKLDDKSRLLFKLAEHGGRTWLLILEIVRNHGWGSRPASPKSPRLRRPRRSSASPAPTWGRCWSAPPWRPRRRARARSRANTCRDFSPASGEPCPAKHQDGARHHSDDCPHHGL